MRLWHDDTRSPPEGWVWARTNDIARELLATGFVTEISLDHDMGAEAGDIYAAGADEDDGTALVGWMLDHNLVPPVVTIHSWNTVGAARMARELVEAGHDVTLAPYVVPGLTVKLRPRGGER